MKEIKNGESVLYGIIGFLAGVVVTSLVVFVTSSGDHRQMMRAMGVGSGNSSAARDHSEMSMKEMTNQLRYKTGDDFDKAFVEMMIAHHEGAIDMAELIPSRAKHIEIKDLGNAIIDAQSKEIADMQRWQKNWGYEPTESMQMMHGGH